MSKVRSDTDAAELDEELRARLYHTVCRTFENEDITDEARESISTSSDLIAEKGLPEYQLMAAVQGGIEKYCYGCDSAPCCALSDPIVLMFSDLKRLAKAKGYSLKKTIKEYIDHYTDEKFPDVQLYKLRKVAPCVFLDSTARCTIYEHRPMTCRLFPLKFNKDGSFIVNRLSYCDCYFNMLVEAVRAMVVQKEFETRDPERWNEMMKSAREQMPSTDELMKLPQTERWRIINQVDQNIQKQFGTENEAIREESEGSDREVWERGVVLGGAPDDGKRVRRKRVKRDAGAKSSKDGGR